MAKPVYVWDGSQWQQVASAVTDLSAYVLIAPAMRQITGDANLVLADAGSIVKANLSAPSTLTVPLNSSVNFPTGTTIRVIQTGSEQLTIAGDTGVTVDSFNGLKAAGQWAELLLTQVFVDQWVLSGNTTT